MVHANVNCWNRLEQIKNCYWPLEIFEIIESYVSFLSQ